MTQSLFRATGPVLPAVVLGLVLALAGCGGGGSVVDESSEEYRVGYDTGTELASEAAYDLSAGIATRDEVSATCDGVIHAWEASTPGELEGWQYQSWWAGCDDGIASVLGGEEAALEGADDESGVERAADQPTTGEAPATEPVAVPEARDVIPFYNETLFRSRLTADEFQGVVERAVENGRAYYRWELEQPSGLPVDATSELVRLKAWGAALETCKQVSSTISEAGVRDVGLPPPVELEGKALSSGEYAQAMSAYGSVVLEGCMYGVGDEAGMRPPVGAGAPQGSSPSSEPPSASEPSQGSPDEGSPLPSPSAKPPMEKPSSAPKSPSTGGEGAPLP